MNENERKAEHGPQSEVTWDGGKGRQPYANQGEEEHSSGGAAEEEGGNRGDASGRNLEQLEQVKELPEVPRR
ncbi:MAG: hypothetical protein JWQ76_5115 [Ramlibacter sp.]|nr:hypothetical protein [Ramlibacter sp.]